MSKRTISLVLIVGGAALLALSLGADLIGIGSRAGMHWKQWTGVVVGLAALAYGFWLGRAKVEGKK
ncbi:MAG: hypothetical protein MUO42_01675 [Anaerolineaceae bacterium]|nr:hypothetical protein [Anaerolineaceae bacterium]